MRVLVLGATGAVGGLLTGMLQDRGDEVSALVRTAKQEQKLSDRGVRTVRGDLASLTVDDLARIFTGHDVIVYTAGSNGGSRDVTTAVDGEAVERAGIAVEQTGIRRFILVSVLPESWRERDLEDDVEYYFAVKKRTEVALTRTDLDWVILRPSLLTDEPGRGRVSLGPAELHDSISRADVAATLCEIVHEPRIRRQILELNTGETPVLTAVRNSIRS